MGFKNPFIFDNRPIPVVGIRFRTGLNVGDFSSRKAWSTFISRLMKEEKSRFKYSQIALIRESIRNNPELYTVSNIKEFINFYMREYFDTIDGIFVNLDLDTKAFVLGMSGFNLKNFQSSFSNC